ncbi:MAG: hypothetical protein ACTSQI_04525 [Candidatus Helarchaeota archaeon]
MESLIFSEFNEKDYIIFEQQILELDLSHPELESQLYRILETKSSSLREKVMMMLKQHRWDLLERAFKRALKRYKTKMTLRYVMSEMFFAGE